MRALDPGTRVRIDRPRALRGVTAIVQRPASGGYEVGFFSDRGRPEHAVVHPRHLTVVDPVDPADPAAREVSG